MKMGQVAAQLFTIRDHAKTAGDFAASMKKIRKIGYGAVQVSGVGPIPTAEIATILQGEGLVCCATHEGNIISAPEAVVERLNGLSCRYTAVPHPGGAKLDTLADVKALAARLDKAGKILHGGGKVLTYHNHNIEFRRVEGQLILDVLYGETDPRFVQGEIDTYWVQYGGGDPVEWCERLKNRLPLLHLKEYATTDKNVHAMAEIGRGNLNWKRIVSAAERSGCEWFIVEQDTCSGDPFESLRISFDYIKENLCT
jgi:sugar phosphate isomerase/epimerase